MPGRKKTSTKLKGPRPAAAPKQAKQAKKKSKVVKTKAAKPKVVAKPKPAKTKPTKLKPAKRPKALAKPKAEKKPKVLAKPMSARGGGRSSANGAPTPIVAAPPSERAMAVSAQLPVERPLTSEEMDAMAKVAVTARRFIGAGGPPESIVKRIGGYVDAIRLGSQREPRSQDVRLGLGVLWGEQLRSLVGWRWVHLTYPDGFASYALVPDDRSFACFPLNRLQDLMRPSTRANTSVRLFESIRDDALPSRRQRAYLVIG